MKRWKRIVCCLFAFNVCMGVGAAESRSEESVTPEAALKAVSIIKSDPLGDRAAAAEEALLLFSIESDDVLITIDTSLTTLLADSAEGEYGQLLFAAFLAGNIGAQLDEGVCEDRREAGMAQLRATYSYLKAHTDLKPVAEIERWIKDNPLPEEERATGGATIDARAEVEKAREMIDAGDPRGAIADHLDPVLKQFENEYENDPRAVYSSDSMAVIKLMAQKAAQCGNDCLVLPGTWADACFLKAYALVEMNELDPAKAALKKAITLSPYNPQFLAELGHIFQMEQNWELSMKAFEKVEEVAEYYDGDEKIYHLTRAWRGMGYVLIEQNKLKKAEKIYEQCLKLNPDDDRAKAELEYIEELRAQ